MPAGADLSPQPLPFSQDWADTGLITADNNWSGVAGVTAYSGDDLTTATGTDPQTITADGSATPVNVIANQTNPNTLATGGVAEFHLANPVVALQGSGTADAPHLVYTLNTTGFKDIHLSYNLRDIDGSTDNAVQPVRLWLRLRLVRLELERELPDDDVGMRTVRGTIRDKDNGSTTYTATVQVVVTFDSLCALTRSYARKASDADALCEKLALAAAGDKEMWLTAYRNQVDEDRVRPREVVHDSSGTAAEAAIDQLVATSRTRSLETPGSRSP